MQRCVVLVPMTKKTCRTQVLLSRQFVSFRGPWNLVSQLTCQVANTATLCGFQQGTKIHLIFCLRHHVTLYLAMRIISQILGQSILAFLSYCYARSPWTTQQLLLNATLSATVSSEDVALLSLTRQNKMSYAFVSYHPQLDYTKHHNVQNIVLFCHGSRWKYARLLWLVLLFIAFHPMHLVS